MRTNGIIQLAPAVRILVFLILGIWIGSKAPVSIPFAFYPSAIAALVAIAFFIRKRPIAVSIISLFAVFLLGCFTYTANERLSQIVLPQGYVDCKSIVSSRITEKKKIINCDLLITEINNKVLSKPIKVKASILKDTINNNWKTIAIGNGLRHSSRLEYPKQFNDSSNFDYPMWMKSHGYKAQTFIPWNKWSPQNVATTNISRSELIRISLQMKLERFIKQHIYQIIGVGEGVNSGMAIIFAMTLGDKTHVDKAMSENFSVAGASHILALSGLHLGIIFSLLSFFFGKNRKRNILVQAIIISFIWAYVLMVGMPVSIIRAATMLTLYSIVGLTCRTKMSLNIFAFTGIVMLLINPLSLWDIGFQLSFLSVASILTIYHNIYNIFSPQTKVGRWIWASIVVSIAAQIGTAPLVAYYFGRFSCYFIIVNLVVIPLATTIIFGSIIATVLTICFAPCSVAFFGLAIIAQTMNKFIMCINNLPFASIENINITYRQVIAYYLILMIMTFVINRKKFRK